MQHTEIFFSAVKSENYIGKCLKFLIFLLKKKKIKIRGMHMIKARSNALLVNNSPPQSHGAYTCTFSRVVVYLLCYKPYDGNKLVKLCGILSNVHAI